MRVERNACVHVANGARVSSSQQPAAANQSAQRGNKRYAQTEGGGGGGKGKGRRQRVRNGGNATNVKATSSCPVGHVSVHGRRVQPGKGHGCNGRCEEPKCVVGAAWGWGRVGMS